MNKVALGWVVALLGASSITMAFVDVSHFWYWLIPGVIPFVVFKFGYAQKCPSCTRWWASVGKGSELVSKWQEHRDVEREDVSRDDSGKELSRTKRVEQVVVSLEEKKYFYQCKHCSAEWSKTVVHSDR